MREIVEPLLQWYDKNGRQLPWRQTPDPYHIWVSEIMLQQTRVEAVKGYYSRFLNRLPNVAALAECDTDELMKLWQGLGYYNRARNLQKAARVIMEKYGGGFPKEYEQLLELPGIGEYTAGAIASIAFGKPVPAVDGNVYRIYTRLKADDSDISRIGIKRKIREEILEIIPEERAGDFNQAWMDLGSGVCLPNGAPLCSQCPLKLSCQSSAQGNMQDYPVKPAKKERRKEEWTVLLLEYQGKYLLQKRPDKGLLAGLWEFPSQEGKLSPEQLLQFVSNWDTQKEDIELLGKGKHIFSHVEWHMLGYRVHLETIPKELKEETWSTLEQMQKIYSIPTAFQCYYQKIS